MLKTRNEVLCNIILDLIEMKNDNDLLERVNEELSENLISHREGDLFEDESPEESVDPIELKLCLDALTDVCEGNRKAIQVIDQLRDLLLPITKDEDDQLNSHLIELGAKQVDLPNEYDYSEPPGGYGKETK